MNKILLDMLFEKTYGDVKTKLGDDVNEEQFYEYLSRKYSEILKGFDLEHGTLEARNLFAEDMVDFYAKKEERIWQYYSKSDLLLSIIEKDEALERLELLAKQASNDAYKYSEYGVYLRSDKKFASRLDELSQCMNDIKEHNRECANKLLLNGFLDLNYAFRKTKYHRP